MNIADKSGIYKNFSGKINWREHTNCVVRNADFEILENGGKNGKHIIFADVVFVSGDIRWCIVKNGLNFGCNFKYCEIEYMINKGGEILNCNWRDGIFEGGTFRFSTWYDGVWIKGVWDGGENIIGELMDSPPDKWKK